MFATVLVICVLALPRFPYECGEDESVRESAVLPLPVKAHQPIAVRVSEREYTPSPTSKPTSIAYKVSWEPEHWHPLLHAQHTATMCEVNPWP